MCFPDADGPTGLPGRLETRDSQKHDRDGHLSFRKRGQLVRYSPGSIQSETLENLYGAGRMVWADDTAFAAVRVMGTCFATGHAARSGCGTAGKSRSDALCGEGTGGTAKTGGTGVNSIGT